MRDTARPRWRGLDCSLSCLSGGGCNGNRHCSHSKTSLIDCVRPQHHLPFPAEVNDENDTADHRHGATQRCNGSQCQEVAHWSRVKLLWKDSYHVDVTTYTLVVFLHSSQWLIFCTPHHQYSEVSQVVALTLSVVFCRLPRLASVLQPIDLQRICRDDTELSSPRDGRCRRRVCLKLGFLTFPGVPRNALPWILFLKQNGRHDCEQQRALHGVFTCRCSLWLMCTNNLFSREVRRETVWFLCFPCVQ